MQHKRHLDGYILKLDQEKAFDRISHQYLFRSFRKVWFWRNIHQLDTGFVYKKTTFLYIIQFDKDVQLVLYYLY